MYASFFRWSSFALVVLDIVHGHLTNHVKAGIALEPNLFVLAIFRACIA
jgi:hypothetical protein